METSEHTGYVIWAYIDLHTIFDSSSFLSLKASFHVLTLVTFQAASFRFLSQCLKGSPKVWINCRSKLLMKEIKHNYRKEILDLFLSLHLRCNLLFTSCTIGSRRVDSVIDGRLDRPQTTLRLPTYSCLLRVVRRKFITINMLIGR